MSAAAGPARPPLPGGQRSLSPAAGGALVAGFVLALVACVPAAAGRHPALAASLLAAAALLATWSAGLCLSTGLRGRRLALEIDPRPQHYVQACAQASVFLYWGWHWPPVRDAAVLIAAQVLFAYAFDLLLAWSRSEAGRLGFGPVPVVFSINLFLWFADDRFHLQLLLVAFAFAAKALIRWERDGRRTHVFNPAAFALAVFGAALLATGTSDLTRGQDIAVSQFFPPHMYLWIFLVALPGQYLFGVTSMTLAAVAATWLFGLAWFTATGVYYFYDAYIPVAVFLGMHLLFTDPSTAPRTAAGRLLFGALYGAGVVAGYALLAGAGLPTFYDKLLPVPLLNLSAGLLDRLAGSRALRRLDPAGSGVLASAGRSTVAGWAGRRARPPAADPGPAGGAEVAAGASRGFLARQSSPSAPLDAQPTRPGVCTVLRRGFLARQSSPLAPLGAQRTLPGVVPRRRLLGRVPAPRRRHLAYMAAWAAVFAVMSATGGVGDRHPGQWLPFWQAACAGDRPGACRYLAARLSGHCAAGSGWACNEIGVLLLTRPAVAAAAGEADPRAASAAWFDQGCSLGFGPACGNLGRIAGASGPFDRAPPGLDDWPVVLRGSKGPVADLGPAALLARACRQGWPDTCGSAD